MKTLRSPLSAFLVAVLLVALFQPVVAAVERQIPETSLAAIPECLSLDILEYNGNIVRLQNEEPDLNSIVYLNHDGTKSLYYFQEAIKYVDSSGHVKDKSDKLYPTPSSISRAGYAYQNTYNDIVTQFPESFTPERGVRVTKDDNNIKTNYPVTPRQKRSRCRSNRGIIDSPTPLFTPFCRFRYRSRGQIRSHQYPRTSSTNDPFLKWFSYASRMMRIAMSTSPF